MVPDSFAVLAEPLIPLESGGNACVRERVTAQSKHAPFAVALRHHRRSTVDGTTRVRPRSNRWRSPGIRTRRCDARYRVRHKRIPRPPRTPNTPAPRFEGRRVAHEPGTLHARSGSCLRGTRDRPDAPRRNPRALARGGCQCEDDGDPNPDRTANRQCSVGHGGHSHGATESTRSLSAGGLTGLRTSA